MLRCQKLANCVGVLAVLAGVACGARALGQQAVRPAAEPKAQESKPVQKKPAEKKPAEKKPGELDKSLEKSLVPAPHPLITEVLFAVPSGGDGDMNKDGTRSATGDEFVELVNPHAVAINLKGYRLTEGQVQTRRGEEREETSPQSKESQRDNKPDNKRDSKPENRPERDEDRLDLTFPELVLQPGEVVVVFNGFEASVPGPVGTREVAAEKNEQFASAYVFTFGASSKYQALSNTNDMVQLIAPDGKGVQGIAWDFRKQRGATPKQDENEAKELEAKEPEASKPEASKPEAEKPDAAKPKQSSPGTIRGGDQKTPRSTPPRTQPKPQLPKHADTALALLEQLTDTAWREGSVQRESAGGDLKPHLRIDGRLASPGEWGKPVNGERGTGNGER